MLFQNLAGAWDELTLEMLEVVHEEDDMHILKVRFAGRGRRQRGRGGQGPLLRA